MMTVSDLCSQYCRDSILCLYILFSAVTVEFDPTSYTVSESGHLANITVVKRGQILIPIVVDFSTVDNSANG